MKNVSIITNMNKDKDLTYTNRIKDLLPDDFNVRVATIKDDIKSALKGADAGIVLGGDGTILCCACSAAREGVPLLGINLGTLGFLAEVERTEAEFAVEKLILGDYRVEDRLMLEATVIRNGSEAAVFTALNDFVVSRSSFRRIIAMDVYVGESLVGRYDGDGLIVATPTGSTGYNLSAGGPIIDIDLCAASITPICQHRSFSTPIVVPADKTVRVQPRDIFSKQAILTTDGQHGFTLECGDVIEIKQSALKTSLIKVHDRGFYDVLSLKHLR